MYFSDRVQTIQARTQAKMETQEDGRHTTITTLLGQMTHTSSLKQCADYGDI